jgi:hypothetical protein
VTRLIDRGALVAAGVGVGVAVTVGISFLLVIPIEPIYSLLSLPSGLLIGYYANQRAGRRGGPWVRLLANGLVAGAICGLTFAVLLLGVKGLFFAADNGYRDPGLGGPITCRAGADCVYRRYLDAGKGAELAAAGITDADSFAGFYWASQLSTAGLLAGLATAGGVAGGALFGVTNRGPRGRPSADPRPV